MWLHWWKHVNTVFIWCFAFLFFNVLMTSSLKPLFSSFGFLSFPLISWNGVFGKCVQACKRAFKRSMVQPRTLSFWNKWPLCYLTTSNPQISFYLVNIIPNGLHFEMQFITTHVHYGSVDIYAWLLSTNINLENKTPLAAQLNGYTYI